jgi:hypothetical protein
VVVKMSLIQRAHMSQLTACQISVQTFPRLGLPKKQGLRSSSERRPHFLMK